MGLADASVIVLAERAGARDVFTLDEHHFRAVRGPVLRLLRADLSPEPILPAVLGRTEILGFG